MKGNRALTCLATLLVLVFGSDGAQAQAATPSFTITASNTTMPSNGLGSIPFTLTSVNGYAGGVLVDCTPPSPPPGANIPTCGAPEPYGPGNLPLGVTLTAASPAVKQSIYIYALPASISASLNARLNRQGPEGTASWALAGALMLGFELRRRRRRWPADLLLAVVMLIGLAGLVACASPFPSFPTLTPGTYTYTVTAVGVGTSFSTSTEVTVTVPSGVVVL